MKTSNAKLARLAFSERLKSALAFRAISASPTSVARDFNLRAPAALTMHAVRRWLLGESIPAQENLLILARWLGVDADWLRYGDVPNERNAHLSQGAAPSGTDARRLLANTRDAPTN